MPKVAAGAAVTTKALRDGRTLVRGLSVAKLRKGDTVELRCKGKGCRKAATRRARAVKKAGTLSLAALVKGMVYAPRAKLVVTVKRAGATTRVIVFTFVKGRAPTRTQRG